MPPGRELLTRDRAEALRIFTEYRWLARARARALGARYGSLLSSGELQSLADEGLFKAAETFEGGTFEGYATTCIRSVVATWLRDRDPLQRRLRRAIRDGRHHSVQFVPFEDHEDDRAIPCTTDDEERFLEADERAFQRGAVESALGALTPKQRTVVQMMLDGKRNHEISTALGVSEPRVTQLRNAAIKALRERIPRD